MKSKKNLEARIELPEGVQADIASLGITIKGPKGEVTRKVIAKSITMVQEDGTIILAPKKRASKNEKTLINTLAAQIRNMIHGVTEGWEYKLKVCSSHFPMTVKIEGSDIKVTNFMGEKATRHLKLKEGVKATLDGEYITIECTDKDLAGQAASDIEKLLKRPAFDRRIFQDGIYIVEKAGVPL